MTNRVISNKQIMANYKIVPITSVRSFIENLMVKIGVNTSHANCLADVLVTGDYRGHFSHGLNRIGNFNIINFIRKIINH